MISMIRKPAAIALQASMKLRTNRFSACVNSVLLNKKESLLLVKESNCKCNKHLRSSSTSSQQNSDGKRDSLLAVLTAVVIGSFIYLIGKASKTPVNQSDANNHVLFEDTRKKSDSLKDARKSKVRPLSLQEAISQATDLCQRVKDESGSPGLVVAVSVDGRLAWTHGFSLGGEKHGGVVASTHKFPITRPILEIFLGVAAEFLYHKKRLGYADVENRLPCSPATVMRIASISKSITMTAVAKAMENGELDIDKPVQSYVNKFPQKTISGKKVAVTTRQLVSHLSGIRHYSKDYINSNKPDKTAATAQLYGNREAAAKETAAKNKLKVSKEFENAEYYVKDVIKSTEEALAMFKDDPLVHEPGTKYLYSTHAWTLVAAVLEGATKHKFPELMHNLFRELGLENTYLDENQPLIYHRSRYYARTKKNVLVNAPYVDCSYKFAGGGMLSTAPDLVQFGNCMLYCYQLPDSTMHTNKNSVRLDGKKEETLVQNHDSGQVCGYLRPGTVRQMWTPLGLTKTDWDKEGYYGMGWVVVPEKPTAGYVDPKQFYVYHTGAAVGASSVLLIFPSPNTEELCNVEQTSAVLPRGVTVAIIVNMIDVTGLSKTALSIAKLFDRTIER